MKTPFSKIKIKTLCFIVIAALLINSAFFIFAADPEPETTGNEETPVDLDQIKMDKSVSDNGDGTFTLKLETYVVGDVEYHETTVETPTDILLVLDQSGSMADDFDGNNTWTYSRTRQYALKNAVTNFINAMAAEGRYNAETSNHRIGIVTFGSGVSVYNSDAPLIELNSTGTTNLLNYVDNLPQNPSGATYVDSGMQKAKDIFTNDINTYNGKNKDNRNRVVVLFSDGEPTHNSSFEINVADSAISAAKDMKDMGISSFSIGIFTGADESNTYGSVDYFTRHGLSGPSAGQNCDYYEASDGTVNSQWLMKSSNSYDIDRYTPASNRFMNFVSSNYPTATKVGLKTASREVTYNPSSMRRRTTVTYRGFSITDVFTRESNRFYMTADDADSLSDRFNKVSEWIKEGGTSIQLFKKSVMKDIISDYFELPTDKDEDGFYIYDKDDIEIYTADCIGQDPDTKEFLFGDLLSVKDPSSRFKEVHAIIKDYVDDSGDRRNVSVTGFDYTANYVGFDPLTDKPCGTKLVVKFIIKPIENFCGGNNVPTNNPDSGIYPDEDSDSLAPFDKPEVNIPLYKPQMKMEFGQDLYIYQGNAIPLESFFVMGKDGKYLADFVDREVVAKNTKLTNGLFAPTATTAYQKEEVIITLTPKEEAHSDSVGTEAVETVKITNTDPFTIHVMEPTTTVTMNDVKSFYGASYTLGDGANASATVTWAEPVTGATEPTECEGVEMPFDETMLKMTYDSTGFTGTITKKDQQVTVTPKFEDDSAVPGTIVYQTTCAHGCNPATRNTSYYLVHPDFCSLTINNVGGDTSDLFVYDVYKDGSYYTSVTIMGAGTGKTATAVLGELPIGSYTVQQNLTWNNKYTSKFTGNKDQATAELTATAPNGTITCTNVPKDISWITAVSSKFSNKFGERGAN